MFMMRWQGMLVAKDEIADNWRENRCSSMAAAIAFRSLFSLAPLVYLVGLVMEVSSGLVAGLVDGESRELLLSLADEFDVEVLDASVVGVVNQIVQQELVANLVVVGISVVILVVGATSVFNELILSVNGIWGVKQEAGLGYILRRRLMALGILGILGLLLLATLLVRSVFWVVDDVILDILPQSQGVGYWLGWLVVPVLIFLFVAVINKQLPRVKLAWSDVWLSALVTTPLFLLGQMGLGWYLGSANVVGRYGSFGAFIVFMLWVYYSSLILLGSVQMVRVSSKLKAQNSNVKTIAS